MSTNDIPLVHMSSPFVCVSVCVCVCVCVRARTHNQVHGVI